MFRCETELALVEPLHFIDKDLIALQLHMLVLFSTLGGLSRKRASLGSLLSDVLLIALNL